EVKSVTLVENGVALFPDAPTKRGVKHVNELIRLKQSGYNAAVLFIVQRSDAKKVSPNRKTDPQFAKALAKAKSVGVKIVAYGSRLDTGGITLLESVPVVL
ncbi:MAG: DNA/RNA nuclease SfsA, partial [Firmicutes bacterium]|nr:DNA/RNA nuclease SfsA [Bacillota bacterium]